MHRPTLIVVCVVAMSLSTDRPAVAQTAQTPSLPKWDFTAHADLFMARQKNEERCCSDDWYHVFAGGAGLGFYWTPNVKSEVDLSSALEGDVYVAEIVPVPNVAFAPHRVGRRHYRQTTLSATQVYQFYRNAWFHPMVGAGLDVQFERARARFEPLRVFRPDFRNSEIIQPEQIEPPTVRTRLRPFVVTGFKAYASDHAFFRMDLKVAPVDDRSQVSWRFGVGIDF